MVKVMCLLRMEVWTLKTPQAMNEEKHKREAYGVARNRDKKGHVVKVNLREYTMCVTSFSAGSRLNMLTLVAVEE